MSTGERSCSYGDETIAYQIVTRPARKTLGIEVHPDGQVLVLAPAERDNAVIAERVQRRARWISRQLATFSRYEHFAAPRRYLSGESHRYLGRQYRLRVLENNESASSEQVKLTRGEILVIGPGKLPPPKIKELLRRWYLDRARDVFESVMTDVFDVFGRSGRGKPRILIREMRGRWGSLSPAGQMTLNSRLVQVPRRCIEYVIVHELCHLDHKNHSPEFFTLLGRAMPDWIIRKQRLEEALL